MEKHREEIDDNDWTQINSGISKFYEEQKENIENNEDFSLNADLQNLLNHLVYITDEIITIICRMVKTNDSILSMIQNSNFLAKILWFNFSYYTIQNQDDLIELLSNISNSEKEKILQIILSNIKIDSNFSKSLLILVSQSMDMDISRISILAKKFIEYNDPQLSSYFYMMMTTTVGKKFKIKNASHLFQISYCMKEYGAMYAKIALENKSIDYIIEYCSHVTNSEDSFFIFSHYADDFFFEKLPQDETIFHIIEDLINNDYQAPNLPTIFVSLFQWDVIAQIFSETSYISYILHDPELQEEFELLVLPKIPLKELNTNQFEGEAKLFILKLKEEHC